MGDDLVRLVLSSAVSPAWVAGVIGVIVYRRLMAFFERREDRRFVEHLAEAFRDQIAGSIEGGRELRISTNPLGFGIGDLDSHALGRETAREGLSQRPHRTPDHGAEGGGRVKPAPQSLSRGTGAEG